MITGVCIRCAGWFREKKREIRSGFEWDFVGKSVESDAETYGLYAGIILRRFF